jgi:hypothetical protein
VVNWWFASAIQKPLQTTDQSLIVVEDEPLIAMMIAELVEELGWSVEGSAHTEAGTLGLLNTCSRSWRCSTSTWD